jgi:serine/threonine-protein kinase
MLGPRSRLGPYEIQSALGVGGMGEVYKAVDTRLDRTVAIKVLSTSLAADPEFRERFDREARTISQLDHPDICALYDVGEHEGMSFLVMQYLEGETLEARLRKGALPLDQALQYAMQIGDALERAHRAGIVHRDLKPGNVMLTKGGAKLLDFGLAKSGPAIGSASGVTSLATVAPLTAKGTILGTFQYMAPEQIEGLATDVRTDIFAFGTLVYEMVTGRKAFTGSTPASMISAILKDQPRPIGELLPLTPPQLDHVIARCLSKDPEDRWQSARDVTRELQWIRTEAAHGKPAALGRAGSRIWNYPAVVTGVAGIVLGAVAATLLLSFGRDRGPSRAGGITRSLIAIAPADRLQAYRSDKVNAEGRPSRTSFAWSPDARSIVFSAAEGDRQMLFLRPLDRDTATAIPGTDDAVGPFFSPDGHWIGFWSNGTLRKVPVDGSGPATAICDARNFFGASWGPDDTIVFARLPGLWRVPASGGAPQSVAEPDQRKGELKYLLPQLLPDGRAVLFTVTHAGMPTWTDTEVVAQSLATGERKVLVHGGADGRYVPSGHLLYISRGTLMAAPFDVRHLEVTGGAGAMLENVMQAANATNEAAESGAGQFAVSAAGSLLYVPGGPLPDPERSLAWVDRSGKIEPLSLPTRAYITPRISPDGRRAAVWTQGDRNVWIVDLVRGVMTRLTSDGRNARAIWTPDGQRLTYATANGGPENLYWRPADGTGAPELLRKSAYPNTASSWSPDGRTLLFMELDRTTGYDVWALSADGDHRAHPILQTKYDEQYAEFSPDGHWIAYVSNETGQTEVYVQPYPGTGARQQVSVGGGTAPAWSRDGKELFYLTARSVGGQAVPLKIMVVPVTLTPTFDAGAPHVLFEGTFGNSAAIRDYDVTPDGRRFLMVQQHERPLASTAELVLAENWTDELLRKVPVH